VVSGKGLETRLYGHSTCRMRNDPRSPDHALPRDLRYLPSLCGSAAHEAPVLDASGFMLPCSVVRQPVAGEAGRRLRPKGQPTAKDCRSIRNRDGSDPSLGRNVFWRPGRYLIAAEGFPAFLDQEHKHAQCGERIGPPPTEHDVGSETGQDHNRQIYPSPGLGAVRQNRATPQSCPYLLFPPGELGNHDDEQRRDRYCHKRDLWPFNVQKARDRLECDVSGEGKM
jgi:hypothetical protein